MTSASVTSLRRFQTFQNQPIKTSQVTRTSSSLSLVSNGWAKSGFSSFRTSRLQICCAVSFFEPEKLLCLSSPNRLQGKITCKFEGNKLYQIHINGHAKPETVQKVVEIVRKQLALPPESEVSPDSKFALLGADSLDTIVMNLEEEFDIRVEEESSENISTVQEAADLIEKLIEKKSAA